MHGGYRPPTCEVIDTPSGPIKVQGPGPVTPELAEAFGEIAGAVRARHAADREADTHG